MMIFYRRTHSLLKTAWIPAMAAGLLVNAGCRQAEVAGLANRPAEVHLPLWFTSPTTDLATDVPVGLGIQLPEHLVPLAREFNLPNWIVYGVVRSIGAREFVANGTYRSFSVVDEQGESNIVIDDLYYDIPIEHTRQLLASIAKECADAESERDRLDVLGSFVKRRHGALILFSFERKPDMKVNLLLTSGKSNDPMETFTRGQPEKLLKIGWQETGGHTVTTIVGPFHYGNAERSFRRTEEEAIRDLAKGLMFKFSHMRKSYIEGGTEVNEDFKEEVYKEDITLRMRGVRVRRRVVDMERGLCMVEVSVPVDGVARQ